MATHPGGAHLIEAFIGKNIEEVFKSTGHSKAAHKIMK